MGRLGGQRGFTLIELMVTVTIAAILLSIAIPSFQNITLRSRQTSAINTFAAMIGRARSEAVSRGRTVVACDSTNSTSANPVCSGNNTWETGWILFVDLDSNSQFGGADILLQVGEPLPAGTMVTGSGFPGGFTDRIIFTRSTGLLDGVNGGGGLKYCDSRGFADIRVLNISISGQVRVATDSNASGAVEDGSGAEVVACRP